MHTTCSRRVTIKKRGRTGPPEGRMRPNLAKGQQLHFYVLMVFPLEGEILPRREGRAVIAVLVWGWGTGT